MPTFELTDASGTYQVEAPDERAALDALMQMNGGSVPVQEGGSSLAGVGKSLGVGAAEGGIALAGLPGDIGSLVGSGVDYAGSKLGFDPSSVRRFKDTAKTAMSVTPAGIFAAPGSGEIKSEIEKVTGQFYKPQGVAEELTHKVGEFLPGMIGGPGSLAAKFATRVAAPAIGSEIGKNIAGPYGEVGGALAGLGGASAAARRFQEMAAARRAARSLPTTEAILTDASDKFKAAENMNFVSAPEWAVNAAAKMRNDLKGFDPEAQSAVFKAADRLENLASSKPPALSPTQKLELEMNGLPVPAANPVPVAMNDVELIRKQLVDLKKSDPKTAGAARRAIESLQESQLAITPAQTIRGDAQAYTSTIKDAIEGWAVGKRSQTAMGKRDLAELNSASAGSGANDDNALRQAYKQLARPVHNTNMPVWKKLGYKDDEGALIEKIAKGGPVGNTARYIGKLAPTGIVSGGLSSGAGFAAAGPLGAVALPAAGYVAKKIGDMSTKKAVAALDSLVRSRSPLAKEVAAQLPPAIVEKLPNYAKLLLATSSLRPIVAPQPVPSGG